MALAKGVVTANFSVTFSKGDGGSILIAEIDDREDGKNGGDTSFAPGEDAYFLIFLGTNVSLVGIYPSLGSTGLIEASSKTVTETLTFYKPENLTADLKYPVQSLVSVTWLGNTLGNYVLDGQTIRVTPDPNSGTYAAGVLEVQYISPCFVYKLNHAPLSVNEYEIAILVVGQVTP